MKRIPLFLALLSIFLLLPDINKAGSTVNQSLQVAQTNTQKSAGKKDTTERKSGSTGLPIVKKQPTSTSQPLLIDRIYEQQKN